MVESLWEDRDLPVLRAVARAAAGGTTAGGTTADVDSLIIGTGFERPVVEESLKDLKAADYIEGAALSMLGPRFKMSQIRLSEKGLRAVGEWPAEASFEQFLEALKDAISSETDGGRRKALQRFLDSAQQVGAAGIGAVLAAYLRRLLGL
jgi:hypothetical protein